MTSSPSLRVCAVASLVVLGAVTAASAQTVNAYGLLDLSVGRTQAPGGKATNGVDSGRMTTSFFGFRGEEDLGGGLKAQFTIESFMRADTGAAARFDADTFWARTASVGLSSASMGSVNLGRNTTSLFVQTLLFNALGDSFGFSPAIRQVFVNGTVTGDTGWSDSVRYNSPSIGGLRFSLHAALGEGNGGRNVGASGAYSSGKFASGLAWQKVQKGATVADSTTWQLAAAYDFGVARLMGQFTSVDNDTTGRSFDITGLGATIPAGKGRVMLQWGRLSPDVGSKRTTLAAGYTYNLSRRSEVYGVLMNDKLSNTSGANNYGLGIRHRF